MLAESCFLDKVCTRSALNTGWETEAVAQWRWVITEVALVSLLSYQGSSPERTQYLCFICFLFRRWRWKRGGGGRLSRGWIVWEGEKNCSIQWRKWAFLWQVEPPSQHKWKCYRLRGLTPDRAWWRVWKSRLVRGVQGERETNVGQYCLRDWLWQEQWLVSEGGILVGWYRVSFWTGVPLKGSPCNKAACVLFWGECWSSTWQGLEVMDR